jgi:hypothetical protein
MPSLLIVVDLHLALNNVNPFLCCHERQEWLPFTLLPSYKMFHKLVSNIKYLGVRMNCPMSRTLSNKYGVSRQIFVKVPNIKFHENPPGVIPADTCGIKKVKVRYCGAYTALPPEDRLSSYP